MKDIEYKLYIGADNSTGERQAKVIAGIVSGFVNGFTLQETKGYWKGVAEDSTVVTIIGNSSNAAMITCLAEKLKLVLDQQAIMVTEKEVEKYFV